MSQPKSPSSWHTVKKGLVVRGGYQATRTYLIDIYSEERKTLRRILEDVVFQCGVLDNQRSNSVVIHGPPGSGKTFLVEHVIRELQTNQKFSDACLIVRLNANLCKDFRSSLYYVKSHLKNTNENWTPEEQEIIALLDDEGDFNDQIELIMNFLKDQLLSLNKAIIFVLDKLELFTEGAHAQQGLLYNLLDLTANKASIPVCVVGITSNDDVHELFEKRVKSRFSQRKIHLKLDYKFEEYFGMAKSLLSVKKDSAWNEGIRKLFEKKELRDIMRVLYNNDNSVAGLVKFLYDVIIRAPQQLVSLKEFQETFKDYSDSSYYLIALGLPTSALCVLLAIYKHMQFNKKRMWQPLGIYEIVKNVSQQNFINQNEFLDGLNLLLKNEFVQVASINGSKDGLCNVDAHYRCDISLSDLNYILKNHPEIPSNFREQL